MMTRCAPTFLLLALLVAIPRLSASADSGMAQPTLQSVALRSPLDPKALDPRLLFCAPLQGHLIDLVSGTAALFTRSSGAAYVGPGGATLVSPESTPCFDWSLSEPALLLRTANATATPPRASEAGVASPVNGLRWAIASLHPGVTTALSPGGQGTVIVDVVPALSKTQVMALGSAQGILSARDSTFSLVQISGSTWNIYTQTASDGAISLATVSYSAGETLRIAVAFGSGYLSIWCKGVSASGAFSGGYTLGRSFWLGYGLSSQMHVKAIKFYNFKAASWAEIQGL